MRISRYFFRFLSLEFFAIRIKSGILIRMIYAAFFLLAAGVVFLSIKLSVYVDWLDKTTKVSGAFIGGVLLAAVTSLPELFTSLSAVLFLRVNDLVTGNILGSNLFNFALLGVCLAVMFRGFSRANVGKHHAVTLLGVLCVYALIAVAVFVKNAPRLGFIHIISPFILVIYIVTLLFTPKTESSEEKTDCPLSLKQLIVRFILAAVLLIAVSICITYVTDAVADRLHLGKTFAGALLLGLTTSLPELVSTVTLCKRGNFNAAVGDIFGSCIFNFVILFLADLLSFHGGNTNVYPYFRDGVSGMQSMWLLLLGAIAALFALLLTLVKTRAPQHKMLGHVVTVSSGSVMAIAYILFLILSTAFAA